MSVSGAVLFLQPRMTDFSEVFKICPTYDSFYLLSLNEIVLTKRDKREKYQTEQQRRDQASGTDGRRARNKRHLSRTDCHRTHNIWREQIYWEETLLLNPLERPGCRLWLVKKHDLIFSYVRHKRSNIKTLVCGVCIQLIQYWAIFISQQIDQSGQSTN